MKNILFILFVFSSALVSAQVKKGALQIGADVGYSMQKSQIANVPSSKSKSFGIDLGLGYAFSQNKTVGIIALYDKAGVSVSKGAGVFYRSYHNITKSLLFYGEASAQYLYQKSPSSFSIRKTRIAQLALAPGLAYMPARWVQFELKIPDLLVFNYSKETDSAPGHPTAETLAFNVLGQGGSLQSLFSLGINFNINNE